MWGPQWVERHMKQGDHCRWGVNINKGVKERMRSFSFWWSFFLYILEREDSRRGKGVHRIGYKPIRWYCPVVIFDIFILVISIVFDFRLLGVGTTGIPSNSMSFSSGFRCNLTNKETTEVTSLLFLLEGCSIREGRRDARVWHPNPSRGFSCNSLFSLLLDLVPPKESIFDVVWRTKVPKKVRFFI